MEDKVKYLQDNLKIYRMAAGLTTTELGKELGVTRQMINNLENKYNNMTLMQYHAIRHVLESLVWDYSIGDYKPRHPLLILIESENLCFTDEYREYVKKGILLYLPAYFSKVASMEEIADHFKNYINRFDGKKWLHIDDKEVEG